MKNNPGNIVQAGFLFNVCKIMQPRRCLSVNFFSFSGQINVGVGLGLDAPLSKGKYFTICH